MGLELASKPHSSHQSEYLPSLISLAEGQFSLKASFTRRIGSTCAQKRLLLHHNLLLMLPIYAAALMRSIPLFKKGFCSFVQLGHSEEPVRPH